MKTVFRVTMRSAYPFQLMDFSPFLVLNFTILLRILILFTDIEKSKIIISFISRIFELKGIEDLLIVSKQIINKYENEKDCII